MAVLVVLPNPLTVSITVKWYPLWTGSESSFELIMCGIPNFCFRKSLQCDIQNLWFNKHRLVDTSCLTHEGGCCGQNLFGHGRNR